MRPAEGAALLPFLAAALAGCLAPGPGMGPAGIPPPRLGDSVDYVDSEGVRHRFEIVGQRSHLSGDFRARTMFEVRYSRDDLEPEAHPGILFLVDSQTHRVHQVRNLCPRWDSQTGRCSAHVMIHWVEGAPWLFGASVFMGVTEVHGGALEVPLPGPAGSVIVARYRVGVEPQGQRIVFELAQAPPIQPRESPIWGYLVRRASFTASSPYPETIEVRSGRQELLFRLADFQVGLGPILERTSPWPDSTPSVERADAFGAFDRRAPPSTGAEPTTFPLTEARLFVEENDEETRRFLESHPRAVLVSGTAIVQEDLPGVVPRPIQGTTTRWTFLYGDLASGEGHEVSVEKEQSSVAATPPEHRILSSNTARLTQGLPKDPDAIPLRHEYFDTAVREIRGLELGLSEFTVGFDLVEPMGWWNEPRFRYSLTYRFESTMGEAAGIGYSVGVASHTARLEVALLPPRVASEL